MSLIVEDGTGLPNAESYTSVVECLAYHTARGSDTWPTISTLQQEQALRRATDYMIQKYKRQWLGVKLKSQENQSLDWPRAYVYTEPFLNGATGYFPYLVPSNIVPTAVKNACSELALRAAAGNLMDDGERSILMEQIGPIKTQYDPDSSSLIKYYQVHTLLKSYLKTNGSGSMMKLSRC